MSFEYTLDAGLNRLIASGTLTIYDVGQARSALLDHPEATLDLAGIDTLDGSGLQLLLVAIRDLGTRIVATSESTNDVLRLVGVTLQQEAAE
ncbi:MAG: hypothetical protein GC151_07395 [Betaproteobacteria bacterium]|nr:hypothetical protein [Betaproteobacteria bacterium]